MVVDFLAGFPTLLLATQLYTPASSEVMAGRVSVPPFTTLLCGRLSLLLTQVRVGGGSPPVVMHTKDTVWPGFTTIGSSTRSLMDGEAVDGEHVRS